MGQWRINGDWIDDFFRKGWSTKPAQQFTSKHEVSWYNPIMLALLTDLGCHIAFFSRKAFGFGREDMGCGDWCQFCWVFYHFSTCCLYMYQYIYIYVFKYLHIDIYIYIFGDGMLELKTYFFDGNGDADIHTSSRIHTKMHSTCSSDVSQTSITYFLLYVFFFSHSLFFIIL